jgi:hypothetical protein
MNDLADGYMRQAMKRLEREERREQRQEAEELRRESLPDLSEFGTPRSCLSVRRACSASHPMHDD